MDDPSHVMYNECQPMYEAIPTIHLFSEGIIAVDGRVARERFTKTTTIISKGKKSKKEQKDNEEDDSDDPDRNKSTQHRHINGNKSLDTLHEISNNNNNNAASNHNFYNNHNNRNHNMIYHNNISNNNNNNNNVNYNHTINNTIYSGSGIKKTVNKRSSQRLKNKQRKAADPNFEPTSADLGSHGSWPERQESEDELKQALAKMDEAYEQKLNEYEVMFVYVCAQLLMFLIEFDALN